MSQWNWPSTPIRIRSDDRVAIVGYAGSGKSTLAKEILQSLQPATDMILWIDPKNENLIGVRASTAEQIMKRPQPLMRYVPATGHKAKNAELNKLLRWAYRRGNIFIWIDEGRIITSASQYPPPLKDIAVAGRTRNIGLGFLTQRAANVLPEAVTEANHLFTFLQQRDADRRTIEERGGNGWEAVLTLPEHGMLYHRLGAREIVEILPTTQKPRRKQNVSQ